MARKKPTPTPEPEPEPKPPLKVVEATRFVKQMELQRKRGKNLGKLAPIVVALVERRPLAPGRRDHALTGDWTGCRECHVEPDWLLTYQIVNDEIRFLATGTHADLFG